MTLNAAWAIPAVFLVAIATLALLNTTVKIRLPAARMQAIDGLRGFLALSVFLHHATIWQDFLHSGQWRLPASTFFAHLGQSSVSLFFMITACLFFTRILDARERPIDWGRLYVSRMTRILPLFFLVTLTATIIVALVKYLDLDAANPAWIVRTARPLLVTAGVAWTLHYEWLFYFMLPLLALTRGVIAPVAALLLAILVMALENWSKINSVLLLNFGAGMASAVLVRQQILRRFLCKPAFSVFAIACMLLAIVLCPIPFSASAIGLLWLAFTVIAAGNSFFGLLTLPICRQLGEITFGIYLLHGPLLFIMLRLVLGLEPAASLTQTEYWLLILTITPFLIVIALLSFIRIERPCMNAAPQLHAWLSSCLPRLRAILKKCF